MTKVMTKSSKVNQRMSSRCSRRNQEQIQDSRGKVEEHFKIQEEGWIQESRFKDQASRIKIKIQDSRIKRRLNQDKYEKDFSKTE